MFVFVAAAFFVTYEGTKSLLGGHFSSMAAPVTHMLAASFGEIVCCTFLPKVFFT